MSIITDIVEIFRQSGFANLPWQNWVMLLVSFVLFYFAIEKKFEPLLLVPIAFGMLLVNVYPSIMADPLMMSSYTGEVVEGAHWYDAGVLRLLYAGVKSSVFPCLIFLGVGAMTDFGPLLANPSSLLLGAAAQLGIYVAFLVSIVSGLIPGFEGFTAQEAASIAIIGGADGPTAIYTTGKLAPQLLGPIAVAAYSYMALIPMIQPPIMRMLTTKKEREIKMTQLREVRKTERIVFPIVVTILVALIIPDAAPLVGMLMLGNLFRECGATERLSDTAQNALCNIVTIMLGVSVGATAEGTIFLSVKTLLIIFIGLIAFCFSTAGGVIFAKIMNVVSKGKINPLIGAAGVSAVPMAARVAQTEGRKYNPSNYLLMHAMGPNVAGVIGSAVAAGFLLMMFGK
ncbi:MAG: sodium ion-translocating decarboxylase subunit beta [Clostridiaceae bacterium]|jgi:oxaloacetate decarboxylase beta subunit|nr:sodium ion-translocating decarboxylase subunit beta [Clostridiaceae bacterium]